MQTLNPPEIVGAKLVEWYSCIVARDVDQAEESKKTVEELISNMRKHDKVDTHYKLVQLRHQFMLLELKMEITPEELEKMKIKADASDNRLKYLYYFMTAQYEMYKHRFKSAIRTFQIAQKYLDNVNDIYERGEFYQRLGFCYYRLDDYTSAIKYTKKSLEILNLSDKHEERAMNCKLIQAYIATELNHYDKAELIYEEILGISEAYPLSQSIIYRGLALNRIRQKKFLDAKKFLIRSLDIDASKNTLTEIQNKYNLANTLYRLGENKEAKKTLDEAEEKSLEYDLIEQIAKSVITRGLYESYNQDMIDDGLEILKQNELYFEFSEMSEEVADFLEDNNQFEEALKYLRLARQAPNNLKLLEDLL
ncbi:response regulator aspartate phosphatase [Alkalicoccobacillus murimartini]|uniref:Response regulator aspartate phosphatase B n=1 Tax=Alkalicoccobacillus murimartini TaxID=171685 RepID=A0ABT9YGY7_9BACI|nr:tetratricopeptide repeat protein [Alkalicoccobacillus murimartini]MDQ0206863.1 response regulator aspartate phosphatase B [Alkalicoccobacillus murimartini]